MSGDYLLRGGHVVDGSGSVPVRADLAIANGRIVHPGDVDVQQATVLDVTGMVVSPGFIDVHTHSDATALGASAADPSPDLAAAAARQGVTTEIAGNCGYSLFPAATEPAHTTGLREFCVALLGPAADPLPSMDAFAARHGAAGRINNIASLLGHSSLRAAVMGFAQRRATESETAKLCSLLDEALAAGATGWSSGLIYPPGTYADTAELVALGKVSKRHGAPYVTHLRDEMSKVEKALEEALEIARRSGTALHVSHHKTAGRYGIGRSTATLAMMDEARSHGVDVSCDVYPYVAASTSLHAMLPPWAADGGFGALLARLREPGQRDRMRASITHGEPDWENTVGNGGWDRIDIASAPRHPHSEGHNIAQLAAHAGQDPLDYVADLLLAESGAVTIISHSMDEADMQRVLAHPGTMIGSDGVPKEGKPHPRWAGTFARVLGRYVRDLGLLSLEDAIRRMTALPARRFGLAGRGRLAPGAVADVAVFDPTAVTDNATFTDPLLPPTGIEHVFVSGTEVLRGGRLLQARPGMAVRRDPRAEQR
ncbi:N-acyl-D-amino-acid deacylase family protein [Arthrobacter sulfonylureivorans]|uniref:N-acyl-D-amino-acid deacylase family protein n=1 Tax=Arthrobacter sulfonylureivorans TaxID=2486855 RepID=UPI0039E5E1D1